MVQQTRGGQRNLSGGLLSRRRVLALLASSVGMAAFAPAGVARAGKDFEFPDLPIPLPIKNRGGAIEIKIPELTLPRFGAPVKLFGEVIPGVIYRSSQPSAKGFSWLRSQGINSIVDLRAEHDDGSAAMSAAGFKEYRHIPIVDLHPPSDQQAEEYLDFVRDGDHWPVLHHCNMGIMRAGTMAVLARYAIEGVPLEDALTESIPFGGGPFLAFDWLTKWAARHRPGEYRIDR